MDYSIKIGGEAGQGVQTIGDTLSRVFSRSGYHAFTMQDYESRVRGGHNFFQIRFSDKPVLSASASIDILIALDKESVSLHASEVSEKGLVMYDSAMIGNVTDNIPQVPKRLEIPLLDIATAHGNKIMANTVATGAVLGILRMKIETLNAIIEETFGKKGDEVINANIDAAIAGYNHAVKHCLQCAFTAEDISKPNMLISGIEGIGLGAIASGCKFYSAYPMTPSTGIMNYLASKEKEYGIVVEQAEDEIAAINMTLGASFAGVRAMTGTAGGGFALMVEGLSLAGITETPIVIALGQRPAPATGLPTRTEQGDLSFALYTAHGEFPRVVFAPGTPVQAFYLTIKAFDIAEKYQIPVLILFDQHLGDSLWTYTGFDVSMIEYNDYRIRGKEFESLKDYKRHAYTETGVSPFGIPGDGKHLVVTDSDEHDEEGHIIEDAETRIKMVQKRLLKKLPLIRTEMTEPFLYGSGQPDIVLVGWGSTFGVMKESVDTLSQNRKIAMLHFSELYPFPAPSPLTQNYLAILNNATTAVCIEHNATGQFARLVKAETGFVFHEKILKYDGRPFTREGLLGELDAVIGRL